MTDQKDYRTYLEFQFKTVHDSLERIEKQTLLTNGRVSELEGEIIDIRTLEYQNCPNISKIAELQKDLKQIKDDLLEYNFLKRYPKLAVLLVGFALIMFGLSVYGAVSSARNSTTDKKTNTIIERIDTNTE